MSVMNKYSFASFLRRIGLIKAADTLKFYYFYVKTFWLRKKFFNENKGVVLPPAYYMYETFNLNYFSYYHKSIETAGWLLGHFEKYKTLKGLKILDWGCGPGRVVRHMPTLVKEPCEFFGTDYNKKYIDWCKNNIPHVAFSVNSLQPPLSYPEKMFDIVYGISIFTHLSETMHYEWFDELMRVLVPGGILLITLHGNAFKLQLSEHEKKQFDNGVLVVKSNTKEGHRTFGAFHPISFVKQMVGNNEILEHIPGNIRHGMPQQDVWIIRKK